MPVLTRRASPNASWIASDYVRHPDEFRGFAHLHRFSRRECGGAWDRRRRGRCRRRIHNPCRLRSLGALRKRRRRRPRPASDRRELPHRRSLQDRSGDDRNPVRPGAGCRLEHEFSPASRGPVVVSCTEPERAGPHGTGDHSRTRSSPIRYGGSTRCGGRVFERNGPGPHGRRRPRDAHRRDLSRRACGAKRPDICGTFDAERPNEHPNQHTDQRPSECIASGSADPGFSVRRRPFVRGDRASVPGDCRKPSCAGAKRAVPNRHLDAGPDD